MTKLLRCILAAWATGAVGTLVVVNVALSLVSPDPAQVRLWIEHGGAVLTVAVNAGLCGALFALLIFR